MTTADSEPPLRYNAADDAHGLADFFQGFVNQLAGREWYRLSPESVADSALLEMAYVLDFAARSDQDLRSRIEATLPLTEGERRWLFGKMAGSIADENDLVDLSDLVLENRMTNLLDRTLRWLEGSVQADDQSPYRGQAAELVDLLGSDAIDWGQRVQPRRSAGLRGS